MLLGGDAEWGRWMHLVLNMFGLFMEDGEGGLTVVGIAVLN